MLRAEANTLTINWTIPMSSHKSRSSQISSQMIHTVSLGRYLLSNPCPNTFAQSQVQKPKISMWLATSEQTSQCSEPGNGPTPFLPLSTMQDLLLDKISSAPGNHAPGGNGSGASEIWTNTQREPSDLATTRGKDLIPHHYCITPKLPAQPSKSKFPPAQSSPALLTN